MKLQTEVSALKERVRVLGYLALIRVQGGLPGGSNAGSGTLKAEEEFAGKAGWGRKIKVPPMQVRTVALASLRTLHPLLYQSGSRPDSGVFEGFLEKSFTKGLLIEWEGLWELQMDGRDEQKQEPEGAREGQRHYQP